MINKKEKKKTQVCKLENFFHKDIDSKHGINKQIQLEVIHYVQLEVIQYVQLEVIQHVQFEVNKTF